MPLAIGGDLSYHLQHGGPFGKKRARHYAAEIALGLHHMHTLDILQVMTSLMTAHLALGSAGRAKEKQVLLEKCCEH